MKIANYAVKNYQFTLVIFIMVIVLGITTLLNMPRSEDPEMHAPTFSVVVIYPAWKILKESVPVSVMVSQSSARNTSTAAM